MRARNKFWVGAAVAAAITFGDVSAARASLIYEPSIMASGQGGDMALIGNTCVNAWSDGPHPATASRRAGTEGAQLGSMDGQQSFRATEPGNSVADFVFEVDAAQAAYINSLLTMETLQFALESNLTDSAPGRFRLADLIDVEVPEPSSLALLAVGLVAAARRARRT